MIRFQFISGENGNLRILYHNQQKQSPITTDKRCNINEVLDLSIRLNSLLNEINQNLHKRVELFNIFKIKAKALFDICFLNFSNDIENEKDSALPQIIIEFDVNLEKNFTSCLGALKIIKDGWETEAIPEIGSKNIKKIGFLAKIFRTD